MVGVPVLVAVAVSVAVGVSLAKRNPCPAIAVATPASNTEFAGITTAVLDAVGDDDGVAVPVCVAVA